MYTHEYIAATTHLLCQLIVSGMIGVAASSSVFSILAMSMDRYVAIRHPIVFRQFFSKRGARCVIVIIWIVAGLLFVPLLIVRTTVVPSNLQSLGMCQFTHR